MLTCPADINMTTATGLPTANVSFNATVTDNVDTIITATSDSVSGSAFSIGQIQVTFIATDNANNTANCTFTITIQGMYC